MRKLFVTILMLSTLAVFPACGGGGGGGGGVPPQAIVKISTLGTLQPGTLIGGIEMTLDLPAGVSVKASPDEFNPDVLVTDEGVLSVSDAAAGGENFDVTGTYDAASNTVALYQWNADVGFGTGEFVTVTCDIATGTTVTATDFTMGSLYATALADSKPITGLTTAMTVEIR